MQNPKVATKVETLRKEADGEVISQRVATREEVLATLTEFMERGEAKDSVRFLFDNIPRYLLIKF